MSRHTTLVRCAIATSVLVLQLLSLDGLISQHRKPPESQGPDSPKKGDLEDRRGRGMPLDENQRQFLGKAIGLPLVIRISTPMRSLKDCRNGLILDLRMRTSGSWPRHTASEKLRARGRNWSGF